MGEFLKFFISVIILSLLIYISNLICKRKFTEEKDDWIGPNIGLSLFFIYLAYLIVYMAHYKPAVFPELHTKENKNK